MRRADAEDGFFVMTEGDENYTSAHYFDFGPTEASIEQLMGYEHHPVIKIAMAYTGGKCGKFKHGTFSSETNSTIAAFLIGVFEGAFLHCGGCEEGVWNPAYDRPLGQPLAPAIKHHNGTYTRGFQSGTTVWFDAKKNVGDVVWE